MDISSLINRVARGKHGAQHLSQSEARSVFTQLLREDADPMQLGAFLIAQRMKGESSAEIAGFIEAVRLGMPEFGEFRAPTGTVDLPCYAGKRRAGLAYINAALKARDAGIPVLVHGVEEVEGRVTAWQVLKRAGVKRSKSLHSATRQLECDGITYIDLADLSPDLFHIYGLRPRLGVRSFANTVARMLNPIQCRGQLNGFFHTPYGVLMAETNCMLGQQRSLIFSGAEGDPELYADRQKVLLAQQDSHTLVMSYPEAGLEPYPKAKRELAQIAAESLAMLDGELTARDAVVVERMLEAFRWASTGELSVAWSEGE